MKQLLVALLDIKEWVYIGVTNNVTESVHVDVHVSILNRWKQFEKMSIVRYTLSTKFRQIFEILFSSDRSSLPPSVHFKKCAACC